MARIAICACGPYNAIENDDRHEKSLLLLLLLIKSPNSPVLRLISNKEKRETPVFPLPISEVAKLRSSDQEQKEQLFSLGDWNTAKVDVKPRSGPRREKTPAHADVDFSDHAKQA